MKSRALPLLIIFLAGAAVYANALGGDFHFDDSHAVLDNPSIRSLGNFGRFFTDAGAFSVLPQNQGYRPLLLVTYALTAALTGVDAHAFIAVNLLIHLLCAMLLWATLGRVLAHLGRARNADAISLAAALIFAVHPLFSECVNYISARSESLSSLLMLASLYAYLRARINRRFIFLAMLAIAGALLTKPTVTIFPLILVAFEAAAAERDSLRAIAPRFFAVTAVVIALGWLSARMTPAFAIRSASIYTREEYFRSELPAIWHYLRLFVLPVGQSGDPNYPLSPSWWEPRTLIAGVLLAAALVAAGIGLARRRYTGASLAVVWFYLCLFPASSLFPLAEVVNEHRPYLAGASLCALAAWGLIEAAPPLRLPRWVPLVAVLVPLAVVTIRRNFVWRSEASLWRDIAEKSPGSARGQMNYGLSLMSSGQLTEAEPHLREAVRLAPFYAYAQINLGNLLLMQGQGKRAEGLSHLDLAVEIGGDLFWSHYYRGLAAERLHEPPAAREKYFAAAAALSPSYADAWYRLSLARDELGNTAGALQAIRHAAELRGSWDDRFMLSYLLLKVGDVRAAQPLLDRLNAERPGNPKVKLNLEYAARLQAAPQ